jgi:phosphoribosylformylglycinamidine (FGAM) synthase PurS component
MNTKAVIEDYYGNTITETPINLSYDDIKRIRLGNFSIADLDIDEHGEEYVRLQYNAVGEIPQSEIDILINNLN